MILNRSKNWWLRLAASEPDVPIGAGVPEVANGCAAYQPTLRERISRKLGFGRPSWPADWEREGLAEAYISVTTVIAFDFRDRLRVLLGGLVIVNSAVKPSVAVEAAETKSSTGVLAPGESF